MTGDITKIAFAIAQGVRTIQDWEAFADYAEDQLQQWYPEALIIVDVARDAPDAGLWITTRAATDDDPPGHLYRVAKEAEAAVAHLWDAYCTQ